MTLGKTVATMIAALVTGVQLMAVNLNTASAEELQSLKGIGAATAAKIIEYRKNDPFDTIDEVMNVKGIGEKKFSKIKNDLEV